MGKLIDLAGQQFGRLVVVEQAENKGSLTAWLCRCECGNETIVRSSNLKRGTTKSCGCLRRENRMLPRGHAAFNSLYGIYKRNAKNHKPPLEFALTKEDFSFLTRMNCHYCGVAPRQEFKKENFNGTYTYSGIDRIDNDRGYTLSNVVSCCDKCNLTKRKMSREEFLGWIDRVYNYQCSLRRN